MPNNPNSLNASPTNLGQVPQSVVGAGQLYVMGEAGYGKPGHVVLWEKLQHWQTKSNGIRMNPANSPILKLMHDTGQIHDVV